MDYKARFYSPHLSRFIQPDTIVPGAGDSQAWNRYSYVLNSPVKYNDPSGHRYECSSNLGEMKCNSYYAGISTIKMTKEKREYFEKVSDPKHFLEALGPGLLTYAAFTVGPAVVADAWKFGSQAVESLTWKTAELCSQSAVCWRLIGAAGAGTGGKYVYDARTGQYRDVSTGRFVSPRDLPWPSNKGFSSGGPVDTVLTNGTIIDRLGKLTGQYAGEPGTSISARGMVPGSENMTYTVLRVVKTIVVPGGSAAGVPEFGARGGGMQYFFAGGIQSWIDKGFLEIMK